MSRASARSWVVRCDEYTTKPLPTEGAARRLLADVEKAGRCNYPHEVVKVGA